MGKFADVPVGATIPCLCQSKNCPATISVMENRETGESLLYHIDQGNRYHHFPMNTATRRYLAYLLLFGTEPSPPSDLTLQAFASRLVIEQEFEERLASIGEGLSEETAEPTQAEES